VNYLESALLNLAINARDAMPSGGKLTLEAANVAADEENCRADPELAPGQYIAICLTDTGSGMTFDTLSRAFEPFFTTNGASLVVDGRPGPHTTAAAVKAASEA
jgi:signal transduction histidine kinase